MEKYRRKAFELISVSGAEYEKLKAENARVLEIAANKDPGTPLGTTLPSFAAIQGSIDRRLQLWEQFTHSYARMYQQDPLLNKWCLLVAIASATVLLPDTRGGVEILCQSEGELPKELRRAFESWVTCLFLTNFAIYEDTISAHLAFHADDTDAMAELPGYFQKLLPLWQQTKKEKSECNAVDANRLIFAWEQYDIVTPIFLLFPEGMQFVSSTGKLQWPRIFKEEALKANLNPHWPDPTVSYGPAEPRARWLLQVYDVFLCWVEKGDNIEKFFQSLSRSKL